MPETKEKPSTYERTKELTDRLEAGMKDLFQSDKYKDYLKTMSHFHHYSNRNIMLINLQHPGATRVASYKLWKEKFNRQVKKGEEGIRIFAPIKSKEPEKKLMEKLDPETGAPLLDENGKVIMEEMTALTSGIKFKLVPVFDVSQTYGDPLPELVENLTGNVEHYAAFMGALKEVSPLPIEVEPMQENQDGYCRFGDKIGIREGMREIQTVSAVIHEITHARLHDKNVETEQATPKSKIVREVEAESCAYVVAQHFGIETSPNSFGYLAEYGSQDMSELKASLDTIRKEANNLINAIDDRFMLICKDRGIDLTTKEPEKPAAPVTPPEPEFTDATRSEAAKQAAKAPPDMVSDETMPDSAIGVSEMNLYGYQYDGMLPLMREKALELYDKDQPVYLLYPDNTEAMVFERSEIEAHDGIFGIDREEWQRLLEYSALSAKNSETAKESGIINGNTDMFGIYQLRDAEELRYHRFASLKQLENDNLAVDRSNYELVYTAPLPPKETLDSIYQLLNEDRPKDYTGHSLSVSDIVVVQRGGEVASHYVDNFGFTELPAFLENERQPERITAPEQVGRIDEQPEFKNQPIYQQPFDIARQNGELDDWHQSRKLNSECAVVIDKAIKDNNYDLYHYNLKTAVQTATEEYGSDRVAWVLANTIQSQHYDGRYSSSNQAWAKEFDIPADSSGILNTHPAIIDGFVTRFREAGAEHEKPSILNALKQGAEKSRHQDKGNDKPQKSKEMEM